MPTCGDCKLGQTGKCMDINPHSGGRPYEFIVEPLDTACSPISKGSYGYNQGERGFTPKEDPDKAVAVKVEQVKKSCGTCLERKDDGKCHVRAPKSFPVEPDWGGGCPHYIKKPAEPARKTTCEDCRYFNGKGMRCSDPSDFHSANLLERKCPAFKLKAPKIEIPDTRIQVKQLQEAHQKSQTTTKETSTMSNAIIRLADSQFNQEVVDFGGLNLDLKEALTELQEKDRKEAARDAAKQILDVIKTADEQIEAQVTEIQRARRLEAAAKKRILEIRKAKAYGLATNNFVPLAVETYSLSEYNVENKDLLKIDESKLPEGWDKKPEAKA